MPPDNLPTPPINTSVGYKDDRVTSPASDAVNLVTEYGAPNDGSGDSWSHIISALEDHSGSGREIYLPSGQYRVPSRDNILAEYAPITLRGDGAYTQIVDDHGEYWSFEIGDHDSFNRVSGVIMRDIAVRGNLLVPDPGVDNNHIEINNIWVDGEIRFASEGDGSQGHGGEHITVSQAPGHGLGVPTYGSPLPKFKSVLTFECGLDSGFYGIDADCIIEDAVSYGNYRGGKSAPDESSEERPVWRNVWFINNGPGGGFQVTDDLPHGLVLENVNAIGNARWGIRLPPIIHGLTGTTIRASGNNTSGERGGNIYLNCPTDLDRIESCDAVNGRGIAVGNGFSGSVGTYVHSGNSSGPGDTSFADNVIQQSCSIPEVPTEEIEPPDQPREPPTVGGYNYPEKGRQDWHIPLNENFANIQGDITALAEFYGLDISVSLSQPAKGTPDWHVPMNENFTKIDGAVNRFIEELRTGGGS